MTNHVNGDHEPDGLCLVCDECDGTEGHVGPHDCGHEDQDDHPLTSHREEESA